MILLTGGLGYIGSHTCMELLAAGYSVCLLDNLSNADRAVYERITRLSGQAPPLYICDTRDETALRSVFAENNIGTVIHFAGLKAVGESVENPLEYYDNNVGGTLTLLKTMRAFGVKRVVFSSSATVYGTLNVSPYTEDMPIGHSSNPYGQTKIVIEDILRDLYRADPEWGVVLLRYFNPLGAHESGELGESPCGIPNNLGPYIAQTAIGHRPHVNVWGDDYSTLDGTGVRDYIHVTDLALGHIAALRRLAGENGLYTYNLGTGKGTSVLELIRAFENACGHEIPYKIGPRRAGDLAVAYADVSKAERELGWKAKYDILRMCQDMWRWQHKFQNESV